MVKCDFAISAPGVIHFATLLIGSVCATLGFMTHLHSSWVTKEEYRLCQTTGKIWNSTSVECPDISLETAFLIMVVLVFFSSVLWYCCEACCLGHSKTAGFFYVIYLILATITLICAGSLYIHSATLIHKLPGPDYTPVLKNMGRVMYAAFHMENADNLTLTDQSIEQTYYQEKLAAGILTIINGILHIFCAWLVIIDRRT